MAQERVLFIDVVLCGQTHMMRFCRPALSSPHTVARSQLSASAGLI